MHRRPHRFTALLATTVVVAVAACSSGDGDVVDGDVAVSATEPGATADSIPSTDVTAVEQTPEPSAPVDTDVAVTDVAVTDDSLPGHVIAPAATLDADLCEDPDAARAAIDGPIRIGTSLPLSGGPAVLFAPIARGQQAYVDHYNNEFGGIGDRELELIVRDDQATPELTAANVSEMILDDQIATISGVVGGANNMAIVGQAGTECVPHLFVVSGVSDLYSDQASWTIPLSIPHELEAEMWVDHVIASGAESLGVVATSDATGLAYRAAVENAAGDAGLDIAGVVTIGPAAATVPADQIAQLAATGVDAIFAAPLGAQCTTFMTGIADQRELPGGFDGEVYLTSSCASATFFSSVENGGDEGVYTSTNLLDVRDPTVIDAHPAVQEYLDSFARVAPQDDPAGLAMVGWLSMELTVAAMQHAFDAGDLSRVGIMTAARNLDASPGVLRDGLTMHLDAADRHAAEGAQLVRWSTEQGRFVDVGASTDREGQLSAT